MKLSVIFFFFLLPAFGFCQESPDIKFGVINPEELNMKYDPSDSTAEAVLLYEKKNIYFTGSSYLVINNEYHARIKILKASASERGNISLTYYNNSKGSEKIYDIEGFTYNTENGKLNITPLTGSFVFDEKISETVHIKKIMLPNVKEGSVIEYRFKHRTPFTINNTPDNWYFQGDIPFKWSELTITIHTRISYRIIFGGFLPPYINKSEKTTCDYDESDATKYRFVIKDAPVFKDESFITSKKDYISKLEFEWASYYMYNVGETFSFSRTWGDVAKFLNKHERFGEQLTKTGYLKNAVIPFLNTDDSLERINAVFNYVTRNFAWNEAYRLLADENLKTVFENKKGTSAELNLLLLLLLRESGIKANPVIISTRGNGEIKEEYPVLDKFNYTIVQVRLAGKDILMDATDPNTVPGFLPVRCLSNKACVIEKDTLRIIPIIPLKSNSLITINAELDSMSNRVTGNYSALEGNYKAYFSRNFIRYHNKKEKGLYEFYKLMKPEWEIENLTVENKEPAESFKLNFNFSEDVALASNNKIYLNAFFLENIKENPFKMKERFYPIDLTYPEEFILLITLKIPRNFMIEKLPEKIALSLPDKSAKYSYVVEEENNIIKIKSRLLIDKSYYSQYEYHSLREFYNLLIQKQAEQIVLRRM